MLFGVWQAQLVKFSERNDGFGAVVAARTLYAKALTAIHKVACHLAGTISVQHPDGTVDHDT